MSTFTRILAAAAISFAAAAPALAQDTSMSERQILNAPTNWTGAYAMTERSAIANAMNAPRFETQRTVEPTAQSAGAYHSQQNGTGGF
jgi:hypothetical protein